MNPRIFNKFFDQAEKFNNAKALKHISPDFARHYKMYNDLHNNRRADVWSDHKRIGIQNRDKERGSWPLMRPFAYRARYTTDDYLQPVQNGPSAVRYVMLLQEIGARGIAILPYGNATSVFIGDEVRIALPMHLLTDKIGTVVDQRQNEWLVKVEMKETIHVWLSLEEMIQVRRDICKKAS